MPLNNTNSFITSLKDFFTAKAASVLLLSKPMPKWIPPANLKNDIFEKEAEKLYRDEISKKSTDNQDAERLINRGNDYYFALMLKKSYREYNKSRLASVAVHESLEKGLSETGFLDQNYKKLGDQLDANG